MSYKAVEYPSIYMRRDSDHSTTIVHANMIGMTTIMDEIETKANKCNANSQDHPVSVNDTDSDVVDAWALRKPKYDNKVEVTYVNSDVDAHAEEYNMNHKRRGTAIIFNHIHFKKMSTRHGAMNDSRKLAKTLEYLGFDVRVYIDPNLKVISSVLQSTAAEDHTDADCLIVAAMSHGESGFLHAAENVYPVDILWTAFTGNRCPSLAGKPKLFFIQACRGTQLDNGVEIIHETDSVGSYSIPAYADIMVAYSTYDGFYSWRNMESGSWFIQALCQELDEHWKTHDLLRMMTSVIRRVAVDYQSFVPHDKRLHEKKQIPSVVTMLTRLMYFTGKQNKNTTNSGDSNV